MIESDNRVLAAAERLRHRIELGIKPDGSPITGSLDELERGLELTHMEWFAYQNAQAKAHAMGVITAGEAQTIYAALNGEGMTTSGWAEGVDLALKVTITSLMAQLIVGPSKEVHS